MSSDLNTAEIATLIIDFHTRSLPREGWIGNDRTHLILGTWYCWHFDLQIAIDKLRTQIKLFNESKGLENSDTVGYHETITVFWMTIIFEFINNFGRNHPFEDVASAIVSAFVGKRDHYADYYSFNIYKSKEARNHWIEPDLKNLINSHRA